MIGHIDNLARYRTLKSRSITAENPDGIPAHGGRAASHLGPGRKGAACITVEPLKRYTLADINGPGCIRRVWFAIKRCLIGFRGFVLRIYWDGNDFPSVECPLGEFFGLPLGRNAPYFSALAAAQEGKGLNAWFPMPFEKRAVIEIELDVPPEVVAESDRFQNCLYWQIDYTLDDEIDENTGRLCCYFHRENPTEKGRDYVVLPKREGKGRFLGVVMGVRTLEPAWWGEGEMKFYLDGDQQWPTLCGTGTEDYIGAAWGMNYGFNLYHGCLFRRQDLVGMYRWHIPDPIYYHEDIRVELQQIGAGRGCGLYERSDDWSSAAFWYEIRTQPLPGVFPDWQKRSVDLKEPREGDVFWCKKDTGPYHDPGNHH